MVKKVRIALFAIGIIMMFLGMPYLLDYSTNEFLKYPLYFGLIVTVIFAPVPTIKKQKSNIIGLPELSPSVPSSLPLQIIN